MKFASLIAAGLFSVALVAEESPKVSIFGHDVYNIAKERGVSLQETVKLLAEAGITGIDISYTRKDMLEELTGAGLRVASLYGFAGQFDADGGEAKMADFIATAKKYGSSRMMLLPDNFPKSRQEYGAAFERIVERTAAFAAKAEAAGLRLSVESFGNRRNCCSYSKYLKQLLDRVPSLRFTVDTGNLHGAGRTDDIVEVVEHAGRRIEHVHLKDIRDRAVTRGFDRAREYVTLGLGDVPNERIVRYVVANGYDGWYTLENPCGPDRLDDFERQIAVLKAWIRRGRTLGAMPKPPRRILDLQGEIDRVAAKGGGRVTVAKGEYEVKPFVLKSNIELHLDEGALVYASTNLADYAAKSGERAFVYAEGAGNVSITGTGVLNGSGWAFKERSGLKGESQPQDLPVMMRFSRCRGLRLEDFTYRDGGAWGCHLRNCDGVVMRRVRCYNHINNTNDGVDIESRNVLIEDCEIDADDDAIVFKTESDRSFEVTNVVVRNCRLASVCSALKFGTGSWCDFRDITVENCRFTRPRGNYRFLWSSVYDYLGVKNDFVGLSGMSLEVVDGGRMENIRIRNIEMEGAYIVPIFIRQHRRNAPVDPRGTYLRNILIENVRGDTAAGRIGCSITGVKGLRPSDITLRDVSLVFPGGGTAADVGGEVPELEKAYPEGVMFRRNLPGWGFYLRHVDNVRFENVSLTTLKPDARPMFFEEDVRK